jgi:hypothetical protein
MLERYSEADYYLQIFSGRQGGARKGIGVSYRLVPVNNNSVGWFPLAELVLKRGLVSPAGWFLQILL